jgi:hypothetical protein
MQLLLLSLANKPADDSQPEPKVWLTLSREQQNETVVLLARLLAKAAAAKVASMSRDTRRKGARDE